MKIRRRGRREGGRGRDGGVEEEQDKREEKQEKEQEQQFGPILLGQWALALGSVETLCLTIDDYDGVYGTLKVKVYNRDLIYLMPD